MEPSQTTTSATTKAPVAAVEVLDQEAGSDLGNGLTSAKSTPQDVQDMRRMGRSQQRVRHFRFLSIASFVAICTAAWEIGLFVITPALVDGGRPALIYGIVWNFIGFGPIYLSMAEMASMAPIAGAQYHWVTVMIGQLSGITSMVGIDMAAHMSEDVKDASRHVPCAMIAVYLINMILIFPALLTLVYHMPSLDDALTDPTLYPAIHVLRHSMSTPWLTVVLTLTILLLVCSNISYLAAVTRDLFAFARDQGFPFSSWIARIDKSRHIPFNAVILTSIFSILLALIYVGSPVAFYAITSLLTVALLQCYCFSIGCLLWRRIAHPETLPPARFTLGKWGVPVNAAAVLYAFWAFFWCFWPQYMDPSAADFNWASVIFVAVLIVAMVHFAFVGRKKYFGPVKLVEGRKGR